MKVFYCSTCFECYYIHPQELVTVCGCTTLVGCVLVYWCVSAGVGWYPKAGWSTTLLYSNKVIYPRSQIEMLIKYSMYHMFMCGHHQTYLQFSMTKQCLIL
jgi:hypothetical protein